MDLNDDDEYSNNNYTSNNKKRTNDEYNNDADDLISQICSRLNGLVTTDATSDDAHVEVFVEVLQCSEPEAKFFLESANWDVATAVSLYLEEQQYSKRRHTGDNSYNYEPPKPMFANKSVNIEGLDPDWRAEVNSMTGCIFFIHIPSGYTQNQVPPGFAEIEQHNDNQDVEMSNRNRYNAQSSVPRCVSTSSMLVNDPDSGGEEDHACDMRSSRSKSEDIYNTRNKHNVSGSFIPISATEMRRSDGSVMHVPSGTYNMSTNTGNTPHPFSESYYGGYLNEIMHTCKCSNEVAMNAMIWCHNDVNKAIEHIKYNNMSGNDDIVGYDISTRSHTDIHDNGISGDDKDDIDNENQMN
jgi:hypothetical protein